MLAGQNDGVAGDASRRADDSGHKHNLAKIMGGMDVE